MDEHMEDELYAAELSADEWREEEADRKRDMMREDGWSYDEMLKRQTHDLMGRYLGPKDDVAPGLFVVDGAAVYDATTDTITAMTPDEFWHKMLDVSDGGGG